MSTPTEAVRDMKAYCPDQSHVHQSHFCHGRRLIADVIEAAEELADTAVYVEDGRAEVMAVRLAVTRLRDAKG